MGLLSNKISGDKVKPGDHIYSWRAAYVYAHHGIYAGDGKVIHFTRGTGLETGSFADKITVSSFPNNLSCPICEGPSNNKDGVISSCLDCFLAGGNLNRFEYNVSWVKFLAKPRGGTCTIARSDPPEEVLFRANFLLRNGFGAFDVIQQNCEDFAIYCKTGLLDLARYGDLGLSGQTSSVTAAGTAALVLAFGGVPMAAFGTYCLCRLVMDIGVLPGKDVIKVPVENLERFAMLNSPHISTT